MAAKNALKDLVTVLLRKRVFGGKHTPEKKLIKLQTRQLNKQQKKDFDKEYLNLIKDEFILRSKKRTGKGSDWHIRLNPRKIKEINEFLENEGKL